MTDDITIVKENINPSAGYLLVEMLNLPSQTKSGIIIASNTNPGIPVLGKVIKPGEGSAFAIGDVLLFRRYSVDEIKFKDAEGEKTLFFVEEKETLAKVSKQ